MALKKTYPELATFSMSSMTDVIFLLLIFFMVTSTIIFPSAIDVNLPHSSEQTSLKPVTEVYIDSVCRYYVVKDRNSELADDKRPHEVSAEQLIAALAVIQQEDSTRSVALYADTKVEYGKVVEVLDIASRHNLKMVLATRASQSAPSPQIVKTPVLKSVK